MLVLSKYCPCPSSCPVGSLAWHRKELAHPKFPALVLDLGNLQESPRCPVDSPVTTSPFLSVFQFLQQLKGVDDI